MAKILQDMVKTKTSISKNTEDFFANKKPIKNFSKEEEKYDFSSNKKPEKGHGLWFIAIIAVVFLIFAISILFSSVSINVDPKVTELKLDNSNTFTAIKNSDTENLPFDLVVLSGSESKIVPTNGLKNINTKAIGQITLLNTFSTSPQNLAIDTRIEGSNGKIYKLDSKISIPGMIKVDKKETPGMIDAGIYAEKDGDEYNSTPINFKILGFKGSSKYEKIYAISKGDIAGGFIGTQPDIAEPDMTSAVSELKTNLQTKLLQ